MAWLQMFWEALKCGEETWSVKCWIVMRDCVGDLLGCDACRWIIAIIDCSLCCNLFNKNNDTRWWWSWIMMCKNKWLQTFSHSSFFFIHHSSFIVQMRKGVAWSANTTPNWDFSLLPFRFLSLSCQKWKWRVRKQTFWY